MRRLVMVVIGAMALTSCSTSSGIEDQAKKSFCVHVAVLPSLAQFGLPVSFADQLVPALQADAHLFDEAQDDRMAAKIRSLASRIKAAHQSADDVDVVIYLDKRITEQQRVSLEAQIRAVPGVASVQYESQTQAYERFKDLYKDQSVLVENITPDALPASFRIQVSDASASSMLETELEEEVGVTKVQAPAINIVTVDISKELESLTKDAACQPLIPTRSPSSSA